MALTMQHPKPGDIVEFTTEDGVVVSIGDITPIPDLRRARLIAVILILVFNALDLILTYTAISMGATEANPMVAWMIETKVAIFVKLGICGLLLWGALRTKESVLFATCGAWMVAGIYFLVVAMNTATIISLISL